MSVGFSLLFHNFKIEFAIGRINGLEWTNGSAAYFTQLACFLLLNNKYVKYTPAEITPSYYL